MKFSFRNFLLEPYRIFFACGALYAVIGIGVWFGWLYGMDHSVMLFTWQQVPQFIHSHIMIYGVIGFYVFGFLMTAFPRFVERPLPSPSFVLTLWFGLVSSQVFLFLGVFLKSNWMIPAGVLESLSYLALFSYLTALYFKTRKTQKNKQPVFILFAVFFGWIGILVSYSYYAFGQAVRYYDLGVEIGTYGFLLLLIVSITYRVVPFFTGNVIPGYLPRRGKYFLEWVFFLVLVYLVLQALNIPLLKKNYILWSINLVLLFLLMNEWRKWIPKNIRQAPMLLVLYCGLGWMLVFLAFSGYELVSHWIHPDPPGFPFLRTPALHALFIGCFGTLLLGISTRVVRGHGGLPLVADRWMLGALVMIQLAVLIRVVIPVLKLNWPVLAGQNYWAGLFWCMGFVIWIFRYFPVLGHPKVNSGKGGN